MGSRTIPREPFWPLPREISTDTIFVVRSLWVSFMVALLGFPGFLVREGVSNPSTMALTNVADDINLVLTVEVVMTY